jgi:hypothetical protein
LISYTKAFTYSVYNFAAQSNFFFVIQSFLLNFLRKVVKILLSARIITARRFINIKNEIIQMRFNCKTAYLQLLLAIKYKLSYLINFKAGAAFFV